MSYNRELLDTEIESLIGALSTLNPGEEGYQETMDSLETLYKLRIEDYSAEESHRNEKAQILEQKKDRYFRLGLGVAELVLPLVFYSVWMRKGFKFEENGTFTSTTFRNLFSRFRPTKM